MSYVYGKRPTPPSDPLITQIKEELYAPTEPYDQVDWNSARWKCAATDTYYARPYVQDFIWWFLYQVEYVYTLPVISQVR